RKGQDRAAARVRPSLRGTRRQADTARFQAAYRQHRPMVERSIPWLTVPPTQQGRNDGQQGNSAANLKVRRCPYSALVLGAGCFPRGGGLSLAARSLIARLQVCDLGLVVTAGVLFLLDVGVLGRFIVYVFLRVGLLGLLFVRFWAED